jgi:hypothetical protein
LPLVHCDVEVQGAPLDWSLTQWLVASQKADATQSAFDPHVPPQALPWQMYGAHGVT